MLDPAEKLSFQVCGEYGHQGTPLPASNQPRDDHGGTPIELLARIALARELCAAAACGQPLVLEPDEADGEIV